MVPAWVSHRVSASSWEPVAGGYTRAPKFRALARDETGVFVKFAEDDDLAVRAIVAELDVYESLSAPFLPVLYGAFQAHDKALLILEDLSEAHWPPPYPPDVAPLFAALDAIAAVRAPDGLPTLAEPAETPWRQIARAPEAFLSLGVCSGTWLIKALPTLIEAEACVPRSGSQLVHNDVWAGNLCFADRGALLVDWAEARVGNAAIDRAFALLSLRVEGAPVSAIDDAPALAAFVTGIVAAEASAPLPAWAPAGSTLRSDQLGDLRVALPWAAGELGLPPP